MKNKRVLLFAVMLVLSLSLIGCGSKQEAKEEQVKEKVVIEDEEIKEIEVSDDIKEQAKKEGVSVSELQKTLDGLTELGAKKYGITKEEYIKQIEDNGDSVLSEWQVASEYMGISITELYEYEKQRDDNMSKEQKETMAGMNDALKMAQDELADMPAIGETEVGNMLGIHENATGEIVVVTMTEEKLKEAFAYGVYKETQNYTDEYSTVFDYVSDAEISDLVEHYETILLNTKGYTKLQPMGVEGALFQGMINETEVYIEIDNSQGGMPTVSTYIDLTTKK